METQYISLNMTPSGVNPIFHISQYDVGRLLGFYVYNGSEVVDLDDYTCTVEATRTDGTQITTNVITNNNSGIFAVTATMSNVADKYNCQLVIVDRNTNRVASLPFIMDVVTAALNGNDSSIYDDRSLYQQYNTSMQAALANEATIRANADILEATTRANAITAEATARQTADNTLQGNINSEASTRAAADTVLQGQIDNFVQLPSGSTAADAELVNIRVKADGTSAATAGNAVREQITRLKNDLGDSVEAILSGEKTVSLSSMTWVNGGINSSGVNYNNKANACRTNDYYVFERNYVTFSDTNGQSSYNLTAFAYDKETSEFVTSWFVKPYNNPTKTDIDTSYKYRFEYSDADKNGIPDYAGLELTYDYKVDYFNDASIDVLNNVEQTEFKVNPAWESGSITGTTGEDVYVVQMIRTSLKYFPPTNIVINTSHAFAFSAYKYTELGAIAKIYNFTESPISIDEGFYRFVYRHTDTNDSIADIVDDVSTEIAFNCSSAVVPNLRVLNESEKNNIICKKTVYPDWQICAIAGATGVVGTNSSSRVISTNDIISINDAVVTIKTSHTYSFYVYVYRYDGSYLRQIRHDLTGNTTLHIAKGFYRFGYVYTDTTDAIDNMILRQQEITIVDTVDTIEETPVDVISPIKNFAQRKPLICFTDDDGHKNVMTKILPIIQRYNVPFTFAICSTLPNTWQFTHLTYTQMHELVDEYNCELMGHGQYPLVGTATDLPVEMTPAEIEAELRDTKLYLEQHGFTVNGYAYPYGRSNETVRELTAKYYKWGAKGNDSTQHIRTNINCVPSFYINRVSFPSGDLKDTQTDLYPDTTSLAYLKGMVDECVANNGWLIFVTHAFYMTSAQETMLGELIEYIQSLNVDTVTMSDAFEIFGNAYEAGDYLGYWNTDGVAISKDGHYDMPASRAIT